MSKSSKRLTPIDPSGAAHSGVGLQDTGDSEHGPTPYDLEKFIPWACAKYCESKNVIIERVEADKYVSSKATKTKKPGKSDTFKSKMQSEYTKMEVRRDTNEEEDERTEIPITASYSGDNVVKLTFCRCEKIPRVVMKVLGLIIKFHPTLTTIVISKGLNTNVISEIATMLQGQCHLSSLVFEGCILPTVPLGNYHTLLDPVSHLTDLSLARCAIGDDMLELLCERLVYPLPASATLAMLTLSSNNITDVGAEALGQCLRSNRALKYINLADNKITNKGFEAILAPLSKFKLSLEENLSASSRYISYWRKKTQLMKDFLSSKTVMPRFTITTDASKKKQPVKPQKTNEKEELFKRAEFFAIQSLGEFNDPFAPSQYETVNGQKYCFGNSILCYLNISYNYLDIYALQKILQVLHYQNRDLCTGIINLRLDGNPLPINCQELLDINDILDCKLSVLTKTKSGKKKG